MATVDNDSELLRHAVAGDESSLTLLLADSHARLCDWISTRIPAWLVGVVDAEDVIVLAYARVFKHISEFEVRGADSFRSWVRTIALRVLSDQVKRFTRGKRDRRRNLGMTPSFEGSMIQLPGCRRTPVRTPSHDASRREADECLRRALGSLPDAERQVIVLRDIEGWRWAEVEACMGKSRSALDRLRDKALRTLHRLLGSASGYLSSTA